MTETVTENGKVYKKESLVMVFDCETLASPLNYIIFDYGWQVVDLDSGDILTEKSFISEELYNSAVEEGQAFLIRDGTVKKSTYLQHVLTGEIKTMQEKDIFTQMKNDLKNVQFLSAYNIIFDKSALEKSHFRTFGREFEELKEVQLLDIYNLACNTILNTEEYRHFCESHEDGSHKFISEKGYYNTGAEACYAYLTQNNEHTETHTALNDVKEETIILLHCFRNYSIKEQYIKPNMQAWTIVNSDKIAKQESSSITEKQKSFLKDLGYTGDFNISKKTASNIISELLHKKEENA